MDALERHTDALARERRRRLAEEPARYTSLPERLQADPDEWEDEPRAAPLIGLFVALLGVAALLGAAYGFVAVTGIGDHSAQEQPLNP